MAKAQESGAPKEKDLTLSDFTRAPRDEKVAEYQRMLATNYGWQDGPREVRDIDSGEMKTVEFGAPHEHIAKTLLGVALRDLRQSLENARLNEARAEIQKQIAAELPDA